MGTLASGATSTATSRTRHHTQARCNHSLCYHSHQVCLLRLSGLRTADVQKKVKQMPFFNCSRNNRITEISDNKSGSSSRRPGFSPSVFGLDSQ